MRVKVTENQRNLVILALIWLAGFLGDRIWFSLDRSVPAWDQAEYLNGALNYWEALKQPYWLSGEWWRSFWLLTNKVPPLFFISTVPFINLLGTSVDSAILIQSFYSAILLISVYGLGIFLFNPTIALWAAGICQILPGLYRYRLEFLTDFPLAALVTFSFFCLTAWKCTAETSKPKTQWQWTVILGVALGLTALFKQTALFFLLTPLVWVLAAKIKNRKWAQVGQLIISFIIALTLLYPWYRTNWLLMLTGGKRATIDSAIAEGDPPLNTFAAWVYYAKITPYLVSIPLFIVPFVGILLAWAKKARKLEFISSLKWLAIFLTGAYLLTSFNVNKDARYILPYLPVLSLILAYGLVSWDQVTRRWGKTLRWETIGLATLLMVLNLFPFRGEFLTSALSPRVQHYPYLGQAFPHAQVIDEIIRTEPYLENTLGVLPSTPVINQHNFNYYGARRDSQVYGRQVGTKVKEVRQDARSLSWFLTKTGDQGSVPLEAQTNITQQVETGGDFQLQKNWLLPDGSTLKLYHQKQPAIAVQPLPKPPQPLQLAVRVPAQVPPGFPVPVTYEWKGTGNELKSGLVLLTWRKQGDPTRRWLHDHAIGLGKLHSVQTGENYQVTEELAMLPPANLPPGVYSLKARYLNRQTGESYALTPNVTLTLEPRTAPIPARELDLVSQLRNLSTGLPQGMKGLEPVFAEIGRINQYDPNQDYLVQAEKTLTERLAREPQNLEWAYALALSQVLQQKVQGAIAALQKVVNLDAQNPYAYAYLSFVYLYNWQPDAAEHYLEKAIALNPHIPEIQALQGIAALMQGHLFAAWQYLHNLNI